MNKKPKKINQIRKKPAQKTIYIIYTKDPKTLNFYNTNLIKLTKLPYRLPKNITLSQIKSQWLKENNISKSTSIMFQTLNYTKIQRLITQIKSKKITAPKNIALKRV